MRKRCGGVTLLHNYMVTWLPSFSLLSLGLLMLPLAGLAATNEMQSAATIPLVEVRGRVVCLPEEMHRLYQAALPTAHEHVYGFKAENGKYYTLLRTKYSEALFADARFREKELLLKG